MIKKNVLFLVLLAKVANVQGESIVKYDKEKLVAKTWILSDLLSRQRAGGRAGRWAG